MTPPSLIGVIRSFLDSPPMSACLEEEDRASCQDPTHRSMAALVRSR